VGGELLVQLQMVGVGLLEVHLRDEPHVPRAGGQEALAEPLRVDTEQPLGRGDALPRPVREQPGADDVLLLPAANGSPHDERGRERVEIPLLDLAGLDVEEIDRAHAVVRDPPAPSVRTAHERTRVAGRACARARCGARPPSGGGVRGRRPRRRRRSVPPRDRAGRTARRACGPPAGARRPSARRARRRASRGGTAPRPEARRPPRRRRGSGRAGARARTHYDA